MTDTHPRDELVNSTRAPGPAAPLGVLDRLFAIDSRSLAVFRIAIASLLLADLAVRAGDVVAMYSDAGMFPRELIVNRFASTWNWSFHFASGSPAVQAVLFCVAAALGIAMLLGYESRLATVGSWMMLLSIQHRVPPISSGAEVLFRLLMFWAMFLPLDRSWSLDRWLDRRRAKQDVPTGHARILSIGTAGILLQMAMMYLFSGLFKANTQWFSGQALAGIMAHDFFAGPLAHQMLHFPAILSLLTWATLALEGLGPILLFSPKFTPAIRIAVVAALILMHVGIGVLMLVGMFSPVAIAGLMLFVPTQFWKSRLFVREPTDEQLAIGAPAVEWTSLRSSPLAQGICALALAYIILLNLNSLPGQPLGFLAPERWSPLSSGLGLRQRWRMFENIPSQDGWYVAKATLANGQQVDLLREGASVEWTRPDNPTSVYPNHYWRKLFREMAYDDEAGFQHFRQPASRYLCREWNAGNPPSRQVVAFDLVYCMVALANGAPQVVAEPLLHLDLSEEQGAAK